MNLHPLNQGGMGYQGVFACVRAHAVLVATTLEDLKQDAAVGAIGVAGIRDEWSALAPSPSFDTNWFVYNSDKN